MRTELPADKTKQMLLVWWIAWAAVLMGLVVIYLFLGRGPAKPEPVAPSPPESSGLPNRSPP